MTLPAVRRAAAAVRTWRHGQAVEQPSHFYCTDDTTCTTPICGASKTGADRGEDCALCGLIFDEVEAGLRVCPFCDDAHWKEAT